MDRELIVRACASKRIPARMHEGIAGYVLEGRPPGHFLQAVFENNLVNAIHRADPENLKFLKRYAQFVYNDVPGDCWGSRLAVEKWMQHGGWRGWERNA